MPKKSKMERIEEGRLLDSSRWEIIKRTPEYKHDILRLRNLIQQIPATEEVGPLLQKCQALRIEVLKKYRLNFIPDIDRKLTKDHLPPTCEGVVDWLFIRDDVDSSDEDYPIHRALNEGRLHIRVDMYQPKAVIMAELNATIDQTLKVMEKSGKAVERACRYAEEWGTYCEIYDMKKEDGLSYAEISRRLASSKDAVRKGYKRAVEIIEKEGWRKIR